MSDQPLPPWLKPAGGGWLLALHVQPGARQTEVQGVHGEALKIRLAAPPVDGKANTELLSFVAAKLRIARSAAELVAGPASRQKRVRVQGDLGVAAIVSALWDDNRLGPLG